MYPRQKLELPLIPVLCFLRVTYLGIYVSSMTMVKSIDELIYDRKQKSLLYSDCWDRDRHKGIVIPAAQISKCPASSVGRA